MSTDRTVRIHRVLRSPPEKVYRAFLEPGAVAKWLPPHGFTVACFPVKVKAASGGWTRAVANVELDKALAACTEAIRINKDDPAPFDSRGLVYLRLGKWTEAFEDYRVAARFLTMPYSRYGAGLAVIAHGGDIPRGEGLVASALERDPKAGDQLNELGFTPEKMKELGAASRAKPN